MASIIKASLNLDAIPKDQAPPAQTAPQVDDLPF